MGGWRADRHRHRGADGPGGRRRGNQQNVFHRDRAGGERIGGLHAPTARRLAGARRSFFAGRLVDSCGDGDTCVDPSAGASIGARARRHANSDARHDAHTNAGFNTCASPTPTATPTPTLAPVSGRTFYLSPDGSDTASGSITAPRKTLLAGSSLLGPGDTLLLRGGTYHDPGNYNWAPTASGTATAPITAKAYPGEIPVFDGGASVPATGWNSHPQIALILKNVSWVTIEDLTFVHFDPWMDGILQTMGRATSPSVGSRATTSTRQGARSITSTSRRTARTS